MSTWMAGGRCSDLGLGLGLRLGLGLGLGLGLVLGVGLVVAVGWGSDELGLKLKTWDTGSYHVNTKVGIGARGNGERSGEWLRRHAPRMSQSCEAAGRKS